jgi:hypothetical protein
VIGAGLLNFTHFNETVGDTLTEFNGFSPRYTLIGKLRSNPMVAKRENTTSVLMIIVSSYICSIFLEFQK